MKNTTVYVCAHACSVCSVVCTAFSQKSAHGWSTSKVCQRGVGVLLSVFAFNYERAPMSCLQQLDALEANNWTSNNIQWNHH